MRFHPSSDDDREVELVNRNRQLAEERAAEWKQEHKSQHEAIKLAEAEGIRQRELDARRRTLMTKVDASEALAYAKRVGEEEG